MSLTAWESALTEMEDELNLQEEALRKGQVTVVPEFTPPDGLGQMPLQFTERAANLVRRIGLLATFVQYQLVAAEGDLRHLERSPRQGGAVALYLDASV